MYRHMPSDMFFAVYKEPYKVILEPPDDIPEGMALNNKFHDFMTTHGRGNWTVLFLFAAMKIPGTMIEVFFSDHVDAIHFKLKFS